MRLTAKVVQVHSADSYVDRIGRVVLQFDQADKSLLTSQIVMRNTAGWKLDDQIEMEARILVPDAEPLRGVAAATDACNKVGA